MSERVTDVIAASAIVSPLWLTSLTTVSQIATVVAPILGVLWLAIQIYIKLYDFITRRRLNKEVKKHESDPDN